MTCVNGLREAHSDKDDIQQFDYLQQEIMILIVFHQNPLNTQLSICLVCFIVSSGHEFMSHLYTILNGTNDNRPDDFHKC